MLFFIKVGASIKTRPKVEPNYPTGSRYLVFAEGHHASVGRISRGEDVWGVVGPLHAVVELRELTHRQRGPNVCFNKANEEVSRAYSSHADLLLVTVLTDSASRKPEPSRTCVCVCVSHLRRVNAEVLKRIKSDEDVSNISVNLQLIISPLEVADYRLLRERRETCHKQDRSDRYSAEINTAEPTSSKNSRFTRSSSGQLSIMRVLRVLILSCLREAKDTIRPQKSGHRM